MGYVETLFGHDSPVLSIDALMRETAVSAGGRDKSARFWKVQEESHLVLRGGGRSKWEDALDGADLDEMVVDGPAKQKRKNAEFIEGSVECVAMVDETTFVSGGDSGYVPLQSRLFLERDSYFAGRSRYGQQHAKRLYLGNRSRTALTSRMWIRRTWTSYENLGG